ncbi:NAD(P)/FAD-dependent oxidoreductase [Halorhodospira halophila]|uniref:FAD-dependent pyridine nucleotide-disulfide oxidoreductase n=1 Tax=Halorhodospira halophila (strain DSM 244 / SL1) TaxID=349124 RepID=A1WXL7_HALHL|nr:FAD-dependent oxidoreductase [Halorhodospira halophila]ABM62429.1 FAD-dependent pyridine nucleotide-disulfide oxidoreductase [Halorhodospira halophila SL1]MBK1729558.1 pyridine nucleotide-disulfide oxidoreductase [Halorhodospira halophila]
MTDHNPSGSEGIDLKRLVEACSRRDFLKLSGMSTGAIAAGALGAGTLLHSQPARAVQTNARIVIVGAGSGGLNAANRLRRALDGAEITLVDRREDHYYQPGLTLVATGYWTRDKTEDRNERYIPRGVNWVQAMVEEYDPENNRIITDEGETLEYDYLLVTTGLELRFDRIEGMSADLIGTHGIGCVYDTPSNACATWDALEDYLQQGGKGLFVRPPGAIKCAGAPLKMTMITEHRLRQREMRGNADLHYYAPGDGLFSQPDIDDFLKRHFPEERDIDVHWHHRVKGIEPEEKRVTFESDEDGEFTESYDFIHLPPSMSAPKPLRESELAAQEGPHADGGWLEVDQYTLQHKRYPNVFGAGDCCGVPIGKTSATVKNMTPVMVENLISVIQDGEPTAEFDGYTSCPLITEIGQAILVEFNYDLEMVPSFGFISPYREHWMAWVMKEHLLLPAYNAMLHGRMS